MAGAKDLEGSFSDVNFPEVLLALARKHRNGMLRAEQGAIIKVIYFRDGEVSFASSNADEDRLGNVFLRAKKLTSEQLSQAMSRVDASTSLGKAFISLGYLSPKELLWGARRQVEDILTSLYLWKQGRYQLFEGPVPKKIANLRLATDKLLVRTIEQVTDRTWILERMGSLATVYVRKQGSEMGDLGEEASALLSRVDGSRTVSDICSQARQDDFTVSKVLYALELLGCLEAPSRAAPKADADEDPMGLNSLSDDMDFSDLFADEEPPVHRRAWPAPLPATKGAETVALALEEVAPVLAQIHASSDDASWVEPEGQVAPDAQESFGELFGTVAISPTKAEAARRASPAELSSILDDETDSLPAPVPAVVPVPEPGGVEGAAERNEAGVSKLLSSSTPKQSDFSYLFDDTVKTPAEQVAPAAGALAPPPPAPTTPEPTGPPAVVTPAKARASAPPAKPAAKEPSRPQPRATPKTQPRPAPDPAPPASGATWLYVIGILAVLAVVAGFLLKNPDLVGLSGGTDKLDALKTPGATTPAEEAPIVETTSPPRTDTPPVEHAPATTPPGSEVEASPTPPATATPEATKSAAIPTPPPATPTPAPTSPPPTSGTGPAADGTTAEMRSAADQLVAANDYASASRKYAEMLRSVTGTSYTVQLELDCQAASVAEALDHGGHNPALYFVPKKLGSRSCFLVLWGLYSNAETAMAAIQALPKALTAASSHPQVIRVDTLRP